MQRSRSRTYIRTKAGNRKGVREQPDVKFNRKRPQDSHYKDVHRYKGNHNSKNKGKYDDSGTKNRDYQYREIIQKKKMEVLEWIK